jgi:hypothetical protein
MIMGCGASTLTCDGCGEIGYHFCICEGKRGCGVVGGKTKAERAAIDAYTKQEYIAVKQKATQEQEIANLRSSADLAISAANDLEKLNDELTAENALLRAELAALKPKPVVTYEYLSVGCGGPYYVSNTYDDDNLKLSFENGQLVKAEVI